MLREPQEGCLVIGDISGYTGLLAETELDHAQDALRDLIRTVVDRLRGPLRLAKLEGDAAFVYSPVARIDGSLLLDTLEGAYFAFQRRLDAISRATTCECNACIRIPGLNLKFVAHHGRFVVERLYGTDELTGADVIVVHRLLKNRVTDETGLRGYALLTDACLAAAAIDPAALHLRKHHESYDELGSVDGWIHDLEARWQRERELKRVTVSDRTAYARIEADLTVPPEIAWTYLTDPRERARLIPGVERIDEVPSDGRRGVGTRNHCVHGDGATLEEILDWRPFEYFTVESSIPGMLRFVSMTELRPTDGGTHVTVRIQRPRGAKDRAALEAIGPEMMPRYQATVDRLKQETSLAAPIAS
ncbi:MAG TPA: DUF2652 domain-containing protein [Candidatus Limnocylindria bacterium]|nr:DUF2652 domain-containing protein [Candidatus Limnocylindria bacterium]